jgi:hypothetical protein
MPLLDFWKTNRDVVLNLSIEQVLANAGDGALRDRSECSIELRQFFNVVPVDRLNAYAHHCLEGAFSKSGVVLQDIVNEIGRRLEFDVEDGLYQGNRTAVGFDGIWRFKDEPDLIIEVKTTDVYTFSLDRLAQYRNRLVGENRIQQNASVLIVVGRADTGALEAQVRGSRYAWDMRLISVERLLKLLQISEKSEESNTLNQVRQLLRPFEYTRIDRIIDLVFDAAADVETQQEIEQATPDGIQSGAVADRSNSDDLETKRRKAVESFGALRSKALVKRSRTMFWSADKRLRVCCAVSKRYGVSRGTRQYWYAFLPKWYDFLREGSDSYLILACMDRDEAFAIPQPALDRYKDDFATTQRRNADHYWHIELFDMTGELTLQLHRAGTRVPIAEYSFEINGKTSTQ